MYISLQLCQILTDFNNFCSAKTEKIYETECAFTYLLLKESVANECVIVCLRQNYIKNLMLTKEDKALIKSVLESKKYGVKRLLKEFPNKKWSKRGVEDFLKRLRTTGSIERAPASGRPRTTRTAQNVDAVGDLVVGRPTEPLHSTDLTRARNTSNK